MASSITAPYHTLSRHAEVPPSQRPCGEMPARLRRSPPREYSIGSSGITSNYRVEQMPIHAMQQEMVTPWYSFFRQ